MAAAETDAGYLVLGSTPDPALAARYGASLGATWALTGLLHEDRAGERRIEATLVDAATAGVLGTLDQAVPAGGLAEVEPLLARWLTARLGVQPLVDLDTPVSNEPAYAALLEGLDEEVNATLLRPTDAGRAAEAERRAVAQHLAALAADPDCAPAEERLLALAAASLEEGGDLGRGIATLEQVTEIRPRSWRAQYLLGELRRQRGDAAGAIVALEHADALKALPDADALRLALLYRDQAAPNVAAARLRRIGPDSEHYADARAALGDIAAGRGDLAGAVARYREAIAGGAPPVARLDLARLLVAAGDRAEAAVELDALLDTERTGELAAQARRLLLGLRQPDLERRLEAAGTTALAGPDTALAAAADELAAIIAVAPELWEAQLGAGLAARRRGDAQGAERHFRRALELWPDQPDALHELGVALLMTDRTNEAVAALEAAAALRPDDAAYLADAGFAHLRAGDLRAARERLILASERDRSDPITQAYLDELGRAEAAASAGTSSR